MHGEAVSSPCRPFLESARSQDGMGLRVNDAWLKSARPLSGVEGRFVNIAALGAGAEDGISAVSGGAHSQTCRLVLANSSASLPTAMSTICGRLPRRLRLSLGLSRDKKSISLKARSSTEQKMRQVISHSGHGISPRRSFGARPFKKRPGVRFGSIWDSHSQQSTIKAADAWH